MINRQDLTLYLRQLLACDQFKDYAPNGLQIEGKPVIKRICSAVTASLDVINKAIALKADALLVHHGYFWRGEEPEITGMKKNRIAALLRHNINLYAYHLPLDCHLELGNNSQLCQLLNLSDIKQHQAGGTANLLWSGNLPEINSAQDFTNLLNRKLGQKPQHISADRPIQRIALCSGAAQDYIIDAYGLGVDAYLSGEVSERTYYQAKELGIHYFACGHHATERFGIQALGGHLAKTYKLSHYYLDSDNPV